MREPLSYPNVQVSGLTKKQLEALDELYPERSPTTADSRDKTMFQGGQRDVIRFLWRQYHLEQEMTQVLNVRKQT